MRNQRLTSRVLNDASLKAWRERTRQAEAVNTMKDTIQRAYRREATRARVTRVLAYFDMVTARRKRNATRRRVRRWRAARNAERTLK